MVGDLREVDLWYLPRGREEAPRDTCADGAVPLSTEEIDALEPFFGQSVEEHPLGCLPEGFCVSVAAPIPEWLLPHLALEQIALTPDDRAALDDIVQRQRRYLSLSAYRGKVLGPGEAPQQSDVPACAVNGVDEFYLAYFVHNDTAFSIRAGKGAAGPEILGLDAYSRVTAGSQRLAMITVVTPPGWPADVRGEAYRTALELGLDPVLVVPGLQRFL